VDPLAAHARLPGRPCAPARAFGVTTNTKKMKNAKKNKACKEGSLFFDFGL
jgi:hypothetical protein